VVVVLVGEPPLLLEPLVEVDFVVEAGEAVIRGHHHGDVVGEHLAQPAQVVVDLAVELEELLLVLAVLLVVFEQEVVDPVGRHKDAEKEVPVVLLDVVFERLEALVEGLVGVLDELGFVLVVTEFRVDVDAVVDIVEVVAEFVGERGVADAGREEARYNALDVALGREGDRDVQHGGVASVVGDPVPDARGLDVPAHRDVGVVGSDLPVLKAVDAGLAGVDAGGERRQQALDSGGTMLSIGPAPPSSAIAVRFSNWSGWSETRLYGTPSMPKKATRVPRRRGDGRTGPYASFSGREQETSFAARIHARHRCRQSLPRRNSASSPDTSRLPDSSSSPSSAW